MALESSLCFIILSGVLASVLEIGYPGFYLELLERLGVLLLVIEKIYCGVYSTFYSQDLRAYSSDIFWCGSPLP
ncbi:hypothetical protein XENTR_v10012788 [Xenopus tropicalis]|nr:hypothetical protein XENTR_v10012788 [Xenopus tropicalis]